MADNIITNANDVEVVIDGSDNEIGTSAEFGDTQFGRLVVDNFTITREEDDSLVSGVGFQLPAGLTNGDITLSFDFTVQGSDARLFNDIATDDGKSKVFSYTARKTDNDGNIQWAFALDTCKATSEEVAATSGDPMEYAVEGIAVSIERTQPQL